MTPAAFADFFWRKKSYGERHADTLITNVSMSNDDYLSFPSFHPGLWGPRRTTPTTNHPPSQEGKQEVSSMPSRCVRCAVFRVFYEHVLSLRLPGRSRFGTDHGFFSSSRLRVFSACFQPQKTPASRRRSPHLSPRAS